MNGRGGGNNIPACKAMSSARSRSLLEAMHFGMGICRMPFAAMRSVTAQSCAEGGFRSEAERARVGKLSLLAAL